SSGGARANWSGGGWPWEYRFVLEREGTDLLDHQRILAREHHDLRAAEAVLQELELHQEVQRRLVGEHLRRDQAGQREREARLERRRARRQVDVHPADQQQVGVVGRRAGDGGAVDEHPKREIARRGEADHRPGEVHGHQHRARLSGSRQGDGERVGGAVNLDVGEVGPGLGGGGRLVDGLLREGGDLGGRQVRRPGGQDLRAEHAHPLPVTVAHQAPPLALVFRSWLQPAISWMTTEAPSNALGSKTMTAGAGAPASSSWPALVSDTWTSTWCACPRPRIEGGMMLLMSTCRV